MDSISMKTMSAEQTEACGEALAPLLRPGDVLLLTGDLGAGKTSLTKGTARGLGVSEPVTSPTFNIMLVHRGAAMTLYHFDLYRLERPEELEDIDYDATLESGGVCIVEWGDRFEVARPADGLKVEILITGDDTREIRLEPIGPRGVELARAWESCCGAVRQEGDDA